MEFSRFSIDLPFNFGTWNSVPFSTNTLPPCTIERSQNEDGKRCVYSQRFTNWQKWKWKSRRQCMCIYGCSLERFQSKKAWERLSERAPACLKMACWITNHLIMWDGGNSTRQFQTMQSVNGFCAQQLQCVSQKTSLIGCYLKQWLCGTLIPFGVYFDKKEEKLLLFYNNNCAQIARCKLCEWYDARRRKYYYHHHHQHRDLLFTIIRSIGLWWIFVSKL